MRRGWRGVIYAATSIVSLVIVNQAWSARSQDPEPLLIRVWKARHEMALLEGEHVLRTFQVALGREPTVGKLHAGDNHTPEGQYYICAKQPRSRFHRFLGISYPNIEDADRAFAEHLITIDDWTDIFLANAKQTTPPWSTPMGGSVGIHGYGGRPPIAADWTAGCIAVSDDDIDYLYDRVPLGTEVVIGD